MFRVCSIFLVFLLIKSTYAQQLPEIEVVGTSLLPGLDIEKEKLPYEVRSFVCDPIQVGVHRLQPTLGSIRIPKAELVHGGDAQHC